MSQYADEQTSAAASSDAAMDYESYQHGYSPLQGRTAFVRTSVLLVTMALFVIVAALFDYRSADALSAGAEEVARAEAPRSYWSIAIGAVLLYVASTFMIVPRKKDMLNTRAWK